MKLGGYFFQLATKSCKLDSRRKVAKVFCQWISGYRICNAKCVTPVFIQFQLFCSIFLSKCKQVFSTILIYDGPTFQSLFLFIFDFSFQSKIGTIKKQQKWEEDSSRMRCGVLNPQPLGHGSCFLTTRP